jgi:hypothetical protein
MANQREFLTTANIYSSFWGLSRLKNFYYISLKELGNDEVGGDGYRSIRPYNCDCAGILSTEEEME